MNDIDRDAHRARRPVAFHPEVSTLLQTIQNALGRNSCVERHVPKRNPLKSTHGHPKPFPPLNPPKPPAAKPRFRYCRLGDSYREPLVTFVRGGEPLTREELDSVLHSEAARRYPQTVGCDYDPLQVAPSNIRKKLRHIEKRSAPLGLTIDAASSSQFSFPEIGDAKRSSDRTFFPAHTKPDWSLLLRRGMKPTPPPTSNTYASSLRKARAAGKLRKFRAPPSSPILRRHREETLHTKRTETPFGRQGESAQDTRTLPLVSSVGRSEAAVGGKMDYELQRLFEEEGPGDVQEENQGSPLSVSSGDSSNDVPRTKWGSHHSRNQQQDQMAEWMRPIRALLAASQTYPSVFIPKPAETKLPDD